MRYIFCYYVVISIQATAADTAAGVLRSAVSTFIAASRWQSKLMQRFISLSQHR